VLLTPIAIVLYLPIMFVAATIKLMTTAAMRNEMELQITLWGVAHDLIVISE
jgi:hypothetical protein